MIKGYAFMARRYLLAQKRRSAMVIISLFLSIALITGIAVSAGSIQNTRILQALELGGNYHFQLPRVTFSEVQELRRQLMVEDVGVMAGFGSVDVQDHYTISMEAYDVNALEMMNYQLKSGRFPGSSSEVALESWMLDILGLEQTVGQQIPFHVFHEEGAQTNYRYREGDYSFTLSGIMEDNPGGKLFSSSVAVLHMDAYSSAISDGSQSVFPFVRFAPQIDPAEGVEQIKQNLNLTDDRIFLNTALFDALYEKNVLTLPAVLLILLIAGITSGAIYNIFNIAVLERVQNLGMLRSVGASPKQVFELVVREALLYSLIALVPGLLGGMVMAVGISGIIYTMMELPTGGLVFSPLLLTLCAGLGFAITLASALKPAVVASRISPLTAIKGHIDQERIKPPKNSLLRSVVFRFWGMTGLLAWQNLFRNRRKAVSTIVGIAMMILLLAGFSFYNTSFDMDNILSHYFPGEFEISNSYWSGDCTVSPDLVQEVQSISGVSRVIPFKQVGGIAQLKTGWMSDDYKRMYADTLYQDRYQLYSNIYGYGDETAEKMRAGVVEGELEWEVFQSGPVAWVIRYEGITMNIGDEIPVLISGSEPMTPFLITVKIAGFLDEPPFNMNTYGSGPGIILHEDQFSRLLDQPGFTPAMQNYRKMIIHAEEGADLAVVGQSIEAVTARHPELAFNSFEDQKIILERQEMQLNILIFTIIAVIVIIGAFSIANTVSTSLLLRTREYGTIRSVGMSDKQLKKMLVIEGALYGIIGGFWGTVSGVIFGLAWFFAMKAGGAFITFSFPLPEILAAWSAAIGISALTALVPARRITDMPIVKAVKAVD